MEILVGSPMAPAAQVCLSFIISQIHKIRSTLDGEKYVEGIVSFHRKIIFKTLHAFKIYHKYQ